MRPPSCPGGASSRAPRLSSGRGRTALRGPGAVAVQAAYQPLGRNSHTNKSKPPQHQFKEKPSSNGHLSRPKRSSSPEMSVIHPRTSSEASTSGRTEADMQVGQLVELSGDDLARRATSDRVNERILGSATLGQLAAVVAEEEAFLDCVNTTTALHRTAMIWRELRAAGLADEAERGGVVESQVLAALRPLLHALCNRMDALLPMYGPRDIGISWWALGVLGHTPRNGLDDMVRVAQSLAPRMSPTDAAHVMWAAAQLRYNIPEALFDRVISSLLANWESCKPAEASMTVWACAKLKFNPGKELFDALSDAIETEPQAFTTRELINVLWACAKLRTSCTKIPANSCAPPCLTAAIEAELCARIKPASSAAPATMDAAARPRRSNSAPPSTSPIAAASTEHRANSTSTSHGSASTPPTLRITPQDAANASWALAKLKQMGGLLQPSRGTMTIAHALAEQSLPMLPRFKAQEIASLVYGMGTLRAAHAPLLDATAREAVGRLHEFKDQEIAMLLLGYSQLRHCPPHDALQALAADIARRAPRLAPRGVSFSMKAFARFECDDEDLWRAVARTAVRRMNNFTTIDISNLLWAASQRGYYDEALLETAALTVERRLRQLQSGGARRMGGRHSAYPRDVRSIIDSCHALGYHPDSLVFTARIEMGDDKIGENW